MFSIAVLKSKKKESSDPTTWEGGSPSWINQPTETYSGHPIREVPWTLPYFTQSLCPECTKVVKAKKFEEDGKVWMEKTCSEHGYYKELISPNANVYMDMFTFRFGDGQGVSNPVTLEGKNCPKDCGICNMHHSHTAVANVDLTNRCDMTCPVCFANANAAGYVCEPDLVEVREMLQNLRDMKPVPAKVVQFAGGEPTIHPQFHKICEMARDMGFWHVQVATNGKNISNLEFARKAKESGLHTLYFQFDGVTDDVQFKTRAEKIMDMKRKVVENCRKVGLKIVLVPTLVKGLNDHQIGDMIRFAVENVDVIVGIAFQPVCFTGRINERNRLEKRYTMTHLAMDVEKQTGWAPAKGAWLPLGCTSPFSKLSEALSGEPSMTITCHPDCGSGAFLFVEPHERKEVRSLTDFFDVRSALIEVGKIAQEVQKKNEKHSRFRGGMKLFTKAKVLNVIRKHFNAKKAPKGLTFSRMLGVLDGYESKDVSQAKEHQTKHAYPTLFIAGMHFQDPYNYDVERVKRCVIHYSARDGKIYPFCTYNSGPYNRDKVEESISVSLDMYKSQADLNMAPSQLPEEVAAESHAKGSVEQKLPSV